MDAEQQELLTEKLAARLKNMECQIENQDQMSKAELRQVIKDYELDKQLLVRLIVVTGVEMGYEEDMMEWSDTVPMAKVNRMANGEMAGTDAYQEIMGRLIML